jgi:hypothetical protein
MVRLIPRYNLHDRLINWPELGQRLEPKSRDAQ